MGYPEAVLVLPLSVGVQLLAVKSIARRAAALRSMALKSMLFCVLAPATLVVFCQEPDGRRVDAGASGRQR